MPQPEPGLETYRVTERDDGVRLDLFLKERIPKMSREGVQRAIRSRVSVKGRPSARPSTRLRAGDEVLVRRPRGEAGAQDGGGEDAPEIRILHADGALLAADKPAGLLVHSTASSRGRSLLDLLRDAGHGPLHLVHRLDRETSGVVCLARHEAAARALARAFASGLVVKTYLAVVFGAVGPDEGTIDLPLGKARRSAVHVKQGTDSDEAKPARTGFRVRSRAGGFTLVEAAPRTGRRHQIRVHLKAIGHPVVGDKLYAGRESHHLRFRERGFDAAMRAELLADRQLLHAWRLDLPHPDGGRLTVTSPLPPDIAAFLAANGIVYHEASPEREPAP